MLLRWITRPSLRSRLQTRLSHLLPSACALCGSTHAEGLCTPCHRQFLALRTHRCRQCAVRLSDANAERCGDCLKQAPAFDATIAACDYAAPLDQLVLALKFGGRLALAPLFARLLRDALLHEHMQHTALPTLLMPVPLGPQRLAERGYNQALEIARPLSRALGIPLEAKLALRLRDTRPQSQLHQNERHANLRNAFSLTPHGMERIRGQHIGLVDDVITTGETLHELAAMLKRFGAARVTNLVFARTPH
ncbi:MAG: ComF family protein [Proteobacteria bacterium]|nr:ComF family protein [Pseudomonadota bacterium]